MENEKLVPLLRFGEFEGNWLSVKLSDVATYTKGFAFKSKDYKRSGIRIVRVSDLGARKIKENCAKIFLAEEMVNNYEKYLLKKGDIIITTVGSKPELLSSSVARGIFISQNYSGLLNQNMLKLNSSKTVINDFLKGYINTPKYFNYVKQIQRGNANQSNITVKDLFNYKLFIPLLPEQQKIANFLTQTDKSLQLLQDKKTGLETYKKGVMQKLFSRELRFKNENGKDFPKWEEKRLELIGKFIGGGTPSKEIKEYWDGNIPWVSSSDISDDSIHNFKIDRFITEKALSESATHLLPTNSILIVSRVGVGKFAVTKKPVCTSQDFTSLVVNEEFDPFFVAYLFRFNKNKFLRYSQGTSIKGFTKGDISSFKLFFPELKEQTKIVDFITQIDQKIEKTTAQIERGEDFKKGVLQGMFV